MKQHITPDLAGDSARWSGALLQAADVRRWLAINVIDPVMTLPSVNGGALLKPQGAGPFPVIVLFPPLRAELSP